MSYIFVSYVHENRQQIDQLCAELEESGVKVWRDTRDISPGMRWKEKIKMAIQGGVFFVACFSKEYYERDKTYMNEELTLAIEELRQRPEKQHPDCFKKQKRAFVKRAFR